MQEVSALYQELLKNKKHRKECKVEIGGITFGENKLISLKTYGSLFRTATVGNTVSRQIEVSLLPGDATIPRMAEIKVYLRLVLGDTASEWIPKGVFFIDTRYQDKSTGVLTLNGYDAMLKSEIVYLPDGGFLEEWPKTMPDVAADIAEQMGVSIDERTALNAGYMVELPVEYTMREVLNYIAAAHGGNWIITDYGQLRLVSLAGIPTETNYLVTERGDAILFGGVRIRV